MSFALPDAIPYLRCPASGTALSLQGEALVSARGERYPIHDGIADLTLPEHRTPASTADYDHIAGLRYNLFLFNPLTMTFTWGLGVLKVPGLMHPGRLLRAGTFLDVPCGTGVFTMRTYRRHPEARILAVDYSPGMLRAARRRAQQAGVTNTVFIRADVARLPVASACLDGCLSMAGLHAFPDPAAATREIGRVLRPGASLRASVACSGERRLSDATIKFTTVPPPPPALVPPMDPAP